MKKWYVLAEDDSEMYFVSVHGPYALKRDAMAAAAKMPEPAAYKDVLKLERDEAVAWASEGYIIAA